MDQSIGHYNQLYNAVWLAMFAFTGLLFLISYNISKSTASLLERIHRSLWDTANKITIDDNDNDNDNEPITSAISIYEIELTVDKFSKLTLQL